ncbi:hypothetical protein GQX74_000262 [Glossina fuscipes]|nr:hypothetical protein GQX74_000262 [Glossina fuscipes]
MPKKAVRDGTTQTEKGGRVNATKRLREEGSTDTTPAKKKVIYPSGSSTSAQAALTERMHRLKAEVEVLQKEIQRMKRIALRERRIYNDDDGMRTNAIKFLERIVGLQSYPDKDAQKKDNDFCLQKVSENIRILKLKKPLICSVNLIACAGSCVP